MSAPLVEKRNFKERVLKCHSIITETHTIRLFPNPDYFLKTILTLSSFYSCSSCLQTLPLTSTIKKQVEYLNKSERVVPALSEETTKTKGRSLKGTPGGRKEKHQRSWWKAQGDVDYEKSPGNAERWMSVLSSSSTPQILFSPLFFFIAPIWHRCQNWWSLYSLPFFFYSKDLCK